MSVSGTWDVDPTAGLGDPSPPPPPDDGGGGGQDGGWNAPDPTANLGAAADAPDPGPSYQPDEPTHKNSYGWDVAGAGPNEPAVQQPDPTANLSGPATPDASASDPTANLSTPDVPRQNDNRSIWDRVKDFGGNAAKEFGGVALSGGLALKDTIEAGNKPWDDPGAFLKDAYTSEGGTLTGAVNDALGVGSRFQGTAAVGLNELKRGNFSAAASDLYSGGLPNIAYAITGDQLPGVSNADYNTKNIVSSHPVSAVLPGSGGSGESPQVVPDWVPVAGGDTLYDLPIAGGLARGAKNLIDTGFNVGQGAAGGDAQGPSIDVGALETDLASGMSPQQAMEKYKGTVGGDILSSLSNPANFAEIPGVAEAVRGIFTTRTAGALAELGSKAEAAKAWSPELSQEATDVLTNRGRIAQGGILDQSAPNAVNTVTETVMRHAPGMTDVDNAANAAANLYDGASKLATGDVNSAARFAENHAATFGGTTDGTLDIMQQIADGAKADAASKAAVSPNAVADMLAEKATAIQNLGTDLRNTALQQAADKLRVDLEQASQLARNVNPAISDRAVNEINAVRALAAKDIVQSDVRAAWYARSGTALPGTENQFVQSMQGIASVFRGLMLAASAPPLALQKFSDEWFRALTQGTVGIRASDTAIGQALGRFGEKRGVQALSDFRAGSTVNRLIQAGELPPTAALADVNPLTFRSSLTGVDRYGNKISGVDRFQALGAPIDKWNQSLIAAPTQHVVLNALYQDTKGLAAARQQFAAQAANAVLQAGAPRATADAVYQRLVNARSNSEFLRAANEIAGMPGFEGGAAQARRIVEAAPPTVPDASMARGAPAREQGIANTQAARAPLPPFESGAPSQRVIDNMNATGGPQGFVKEVTSPPAKPFEYTRKNPDLPINPETGKAPTPVEIAPEKIAKGMEGPTPLNRREQANATMERIKAAGGDIRAVSREEYQQARDFLRKPQDMGDTSIGGKFGARGNRSTTYRDIVGKEWDEADAGGGHDFTKFFSGGLPPVPERFAGMTAANAPRSIMKDWAQNPVEALGGVPKNVRAAAEGMGLSIRPSETIEAYAARLRENKILFPGGSGGRGIDLAAGGDGGAGYLSRQQRAIRDDINAMGGFGTGETRGFKSGSAPGSGGRRAGVSDQLIADWRAGVKDPNQIAELARQTYAEARAANDIPRLHRIEDRLLDNGQAAISTGNRAAYQQLNDVRYQLFGESTLSPVGRTVRRGDELRAAFAPEPPAAEAPTPFTRRSINEPAIGPGVYEPVGRPRFNASDRHDFVSPDSALASGINEKTWYHGTGHDFLDASNLASDATNPGGLFGPGMYLTDNPRIAGEYAATRARQSAKDTLWYTGKGVPETPTVYETRVNAQRTLDVERPAPADVRAIFERQFPGRINASDPALTTQDLYRQLKQVAGSSTWSDYYIDVNRELRQAGYDGLTHTGGLQTGGESHRVFIGLEPQDGRQVIRDMRPYQEPTPFTRAPEPSIGVDRGMLDRVGQPGPFPREGSSSPFERAPDVVADPTAGLGAPTEVRPAPIADPTAGLGATVRTPGYNITPDLTAALTAPTGDLAAAQAGIRQAGAAFGDAGQAAIGKGLERGYRIVGNNADQTTAGSWMKNGIGGVTPPILPFAPFHIHSAQFWAGYFAAHPAMAMGMAQVLANLDDYGTLHLPGGTTVAGLIKLTTGLHVMEWAQKAYDYHQDVKAAGNNNFGQRLLKDFAYSGIGNNAFVRPFEYVSGPIQSITQGATNPLLTGAKNFDGTPKVDPRDLLKEYGTMAGTTGLGQTLNDLTGATVPRNVISGLTNPGQALGNALQRATDNIPFLNVDRSQYKPESTEAHALGKVADSMGLSKYQAEKAYYDPKAPAEIALGKQLHDAVHMSVDTQAIGKLAPVQVNGPESKMEAKGIFAPTKLSNIELDQTIGPNGFSAKDLLGQPGNYYDTLNKIDALKKQYGDKSPQVRAMEGELAKIRAADVSQASGVLGPYFDQLRQDSLAKYGDTSFRGTLKPNEQSAYDAFNDLKASPDYKHYLDLEKQQASAGAFGSPEEKAWYKANGTELNRLKDVIAGAETSIVQRYGVNPKELSNRQSVAAGYSPPYADTTIKGASGSSTGNPSATGQGSKYPANTGNTQSRSGASASSRSNYQTGRTSSASSNQQAGNDFFDFYKGVTDKAEKGAVLRALDAGGVNVLGEKNVPAARYEAALAVAQAALDKARTAPAASGSGAASRSIPGFSGYRMTPEEMQAALRGQWSPDAARVTLPGGGGNRAPGPQTSASGKSAATPTNLPGGSGVPAGYFRGKDGKIRPSKFAA